jgi:soluble lytic murein transglycosylase
VGQARRHIETGEAQKAIPLLEGYLKRKNPQQAVQARYLLGHAFLRCQRWGQAADLFGALAPLYPLLADYCRLHGARARYREKKLAEAAMVAASVEEASLLKTEAELVRADALRALGRPSEAAVIWRAYLGRRTDGARVPEAHFRIAEALELEARGAGQASEARRTEALQHYRQITIKAPLSSLRAEAEKKIAALVRSVPDGVAKARLSPGERFEQAMGYFKAMRNEESEAAFAGILRDRGLSPTLRCKATFYLAQSIFKQRQRARSASTYDEAATLCRRAGEKDLVVKSLYDGGRGLANGKQYTEAIERFRVLEKEFPSHSYADDARLLIAEAFEMMKQKDAASRALAGLSAAYPDGDMVHEALWRLARAAYLDKRYAEALSHLDRAVKELGRPRYYYALGQAPYWKGRILEQTGRPREAAQAYEQCAREFPLSYYALLAFNRLREKHGPLFRRLEQELIAPIGSHRGHWSFEPSAVFARPGFTRGVELARLGFGSDAERELARAGLGLKSGITDGLGPGDSGRWLTAVLYDGAGLWHLSHQLPRSVDTAYKRTYPLGEDFRKWALAYPRAFFPLVHLSARQSAVPEELILSIMREESGFSTVIESYANAVGLMQLILPTARAAGSEHGLKVTRETLHDPAANIKLGSTYLGFLLRAFQGNIPLAIASYNAGEGAAYRWLRAMGKVPLDEFLDRIPYDQTRRYTKRVLSTLFTYSALYGGRAARIPRIGQRLPVVRPRAFGKR